MLMMMMMMMMMMIMNCFCGMVDRRNAFSFISSWEHCQRSSPSQIWHTASRVWTCAEPEFRLSSMKLCSSDNHYTTAPRWKVAPCCSCENEKSVKFPLENPVKVCQIRVSSNFQLTKLLSSIFSYKNLSSIIFSLDFLLCGLCLQHKISASNEHIEIPSLVCIHPLFFLGRKGEPPITFSKRGAWQDLNF